MSQHPDKGYLEHILQAIAKIQRFTDTIDKDEFLKNDLIQDAVVRNLEIVGEAVSKLSAEFKASYPDIPWRQISDMRNRLIHGYLTVNMNIVWDTIVAVLPPFKEQITKIRNSLEE